MVVYCSLITLLRGGLDLAAAAIARRFGDVDADPVPVLTLRTLRVPSPLRTSPRHSRRVAATAHDAEHGLHECPGRLTRVRLLLLRNRFAVRRARRFEIREADRTVLLVVVE